MGRNRCHGNFCTSVYTDQKLLTSFVCAPVYVKSRAVMHTKSGQKNAGSTLY